MDHRPLKHFATDENLRIGNRGNAVADGITHYANCICGVVDAVT